MSYSSQNLMTAINDSKTKVFLVVAVVAAIAFLSTWAAGLLVSPQPSWPFRYRFLGMAFVTSLTCTYMWARHVARQQIAAQRYFEALARVDEAKLARGTLASDLPSLPPTSPWSATANYFTEVFRNHCGRVEQMDHARAALEVRIKRNATRQGQIETILATLPEAVIVVDSADQLILTNPAAERLLGIDLLVNENRNITQILHSEALVDLIGEMRRRKGPTQRTVEIDMTDEDGKPQCYGATARTLASRDVRGDENPATGVLVVLRNMSQLKASHKRNAEFVSAVSHEMKTPLAGIKAYAEMLADGDADDEKTREEFLSVINGQANRLQRLIDNLLNLARIEAGVVQVSKESTSLNELLQETLELVRPAAEAKHIKLTADLSNMYIGVLIDRDMMTQAAINLLSNAIKYTPEHGRVTLRSRPADEQAVFEVEDTGVGLCEEDQARIFERFYRVKKDRDMASGTGLGLPLAKHIVEDVHGGRLSVKSEVGSGSTFCVSLPMAAQMACHV
ncbi:MAG TPA: ATP-binding protein [Pirellulales bacterium]|jgi:two-component system phosphate regulon sensor histidine kinase PhoR